jgi:hypothetical protein
MNTKHTRLFLALVLSFCIAVAACGGNGTEIVRVDVTTTALPESTTQMAPTLAEEISTEVSNPSPTPTSSAVLSEENAFGGGNVAPTTTPPSPAEGVLDDLQKELVIGFEGGGGPPACLEQPAGPLPQAEVDPFDSPPEYMCLWGFPIGSAVSVELHSPSGQFVAAQEVIVNDERDGVGTVDFPLTFAGQPTGDWTLLANSSGMSLEASFRVNESRLPRILVLPSGSGVFSGVGWSAENTYYVGDEVVIFGAGFPSDQGLPLGIYYWQMGSVESVELVYAEEVQTDAHGRFEIHTSVEALASQGDGRYSVIVPLDPSYEPIIDHLDPLGAMDGFVVTSPG